MKKRLMIIISSLLAAMVFMSGGYGLWQETLNIKGSITVPEPPPPPPEETVSVEGESIDANSIGDEVDATGQDALQGLEEEQTVEQGSDIQSDNASDGDAQVEEQEAEQEPMNQEDDEQQLDSQQIEQQAEDKDGQEEAGTQQDVNQTPETESIAETE